LKEGHEVVTQGDDSSLDTKVNIIQLLSVNVTADLKQGDRSPQGRANVDKGAAASVSSHTLAL
jgi:hypothetical protein